MNTKTAITITVSAIVGMCVAFGGAFLLLKMEVKPETSQSTAIASESITSQVNAPANQLASGPVSAENGSDNNEIPNKLIGTTAQKPDIEKTGYPSIVVKTTEYTRNADGSTYVHELTTADPRALKLVVKMYKEHADCIYKLDGECNGTLMLADYATPSFKNTIMSTEHYVNGEDLGCSVFPADPMFYTTDDYSSHEKVVISGTEMPDSNDVYVKVGKRVGLSFTVKCTGKSCKVDDIYNDKKGSLKEAIQSQCR